MSDIYYKKYIPEKSGINNILNEYCEKRRNDSIDREYICIFEEILDFVYDIFDIDEMFRRIEMIDDKYIFAGNLNISIMEAFIGVLQNTSREQHYSKKAIRERYNIIMYKTLEKSQKKEENNPFTTSTGSFDSINNRFKICEEILLVR